MTTSMVQRVRHEERMAGRTEGQQRFVLSMLTKRLGVVPTEICEHIQDIHDEVVLESLNIEAALCTSLDEFKTKLLW